MKKLAFILSFFAFTFTACSKDNEKNNDDKNDNGDTEQNVGAEIQLILPGDEELVLIKENITSPIWRIPILEESEGGKKELGFIVSTNNNTYTFTTNINIKGAGSYPLISNMGTLQEGVVIGVLKSYSNNPDEVYAMDREEQGEFVVQSMSNGVLKGSMKGKVTLHSNRDPGKKIIVNKMTLNLNYVLESDL